MAQTKLYADELQRAIQALATFFQFGSELTISSPVLAGIPPDSDPSDNSYQFTWEKSHTDPITEQTQSNIYCRRR